MTTLIERFKYTVESKNHILDLRISDGYEKVYFQVHLIENKGVVLYWNHARFGGEFVKLARNFRDRNLSNESVFEDIINHPDFSDYIREHFISFYNAVLNDEQQTVIKNVLTADIPMDVTYPKGRDGFHYALTIYGEQERTYTSWCILPKEWRVMVPMINMFVELANLNYNAKT